MNCIGERVYPSFDSFDYVTVTDFPDLDRLNAAKFYPKDHKVFTEKMFEELCINYIKYQVERLTEDLLNRSITSNSTSKIDNLVFEWDLEIKQRLINIFKSMIQ
jgi:hypothetical protein